MFFFRHLTPKKIITCTQCHARIRFPMKPGKTLNVTCPTCRKSYRVSFVNPLTQLIKGQQKWADLTYADKAKLGMLGLAILVCLGLIVSSLSKPIKPALPSNGVEYAI